MPATLTRPTATSYATAPARARRPKRRGQDELTYLDEFCGMGGSTAGAFQVPGLVPYFAANHNEQAIATHAANHPDVEHYEGDVQKIRVADVFPRVKVYWASPACPAWSDARGVSRTFDKANQLTLWGAELTEEEAKATRSRALMEEVVNYLRACADDHDPVLVGVVENVIQCRQWSDWHRWIGEIRALGYEVKTIALNSMHALAPYSPRCPQSRDRLYVAYWHKSLGRTPDFARWLRPVAWCPDCETWVRCIQAFKKPGADMGRYRAQYVYRCPNTRCRNRVVEPDVLPASAVIDWSDPGTPIGERTRPLKENTLARIRAGIEKYWAPLLTPTGGTWREGAIPLSHPMPTRTTRESDGLAVPPMMVPMEGRQGKQAASADQPIRTQTCRRETAVAFPPFMTPMRGGGDKERAYRADERPMHTFTAGGFHHGLASGVRSVDPLLVQYYGNGRTLPASGPIGTLPTKERYGLASPGSQPVNVDEVLFRMLSIGEIRDAMAFEPTYRLLDYSKRDQARLLGNAVTPPAAEVLLSALVEAVTGQKRESGWDAYMRLALAA
ncbi:DNA cytosine methyltransferase [Nocardiopsis sp. NPDC006198]|uniref:DNA cytosine methyltransferase n=1 Tax=Nocardiopsis sp. NPDC006198 TaxID=3154472 RepID=UPI0033BCB586